MTLRKRPRGFSWIFPVVLSALGIAPKAALAADPDVTDDESQVPARTGREVVVHGERPNGYAVHGQVTGSRAARPITDVPQSIAAVPATLLSDTGARRIDDAIALTPSVQLGAGFGLLWEDYYVRGSRVWSGTMYRNGYLGGYSGLSATDAVNVERIEILRGPAAALYGPGLPGGSINVITKRPDFRTQGTFSIGAGSFGTARASADVTGPLAPNVAMRVTAAADDTSGYRDFNEASRIVADPVVLFTPSRQTRILLETQLFRVRYRPDSRGVPIVNGDVFALPNSRSLIEPTTPLTAFDGVLTRAELEHRLADDLSLRVGLQTQAALQDEHAVVFLGLRPDGRTLDRLPTHYRAASRDIALQGGLEWRAMTGPVEHDVVIGSDLRFEKIGWRVGAAADPFPIDIFNPVYGGAAPPVTEQGGPDNDWKYFDAGLYFNDVVHLTGQLRAVLGGRVDSYQQTSDAPIASVNEQKGELAPSGRAGLIYDVASGVSTYASVSRGFWPVLGVSADAKLLAPERSVGTEIGARFNAAKDVVTADLAGFSTWNQHITLPDPKAPDFQVQRDQAVTRGIELMMTARPLPILKLLASYTLEDARVTEDPDSTLVDTPLPFVSRHAGGGWAMVDIPLDRLVLEVGGGARAVGERHLNDGTAIPGYAKVDGAIKLRLANASIAFYARNLFNTRYAESGNDVSSVLFGAPRSFFVSATGSI